MTPIGIKRPPQPGRRQQTGRALQNERVQQGAVLWGLGFSGVLTLLLVPLPPLPEDVVLPFSPMVAKLLNLIPPTILMTLAVITGTKLAPRTGLDAPLLLSLVRGTSRLATLHRQLRSGTVGGLIGGLLLIVAQYWQPDALQMVQEEVTIPTSVGVLYGGITEEIMLRWGLMSFVAWVGLRLFYQSRASVPATPYVFAIGVTALLFGVGHLPVVYAYVDNVTLPLITYVVGINALFGIVAGFLYWKYGLETSFIAHSTAHLFAYAVSLLGGWIG